VFSGSPGQEFASVHTAHEGRNQSRHSGRPTAWASWSRSWGGPTQPGGGTEGVRVWTVAAGRSARKPPGPPARTSGRTDGVWRGTDGWSDCGV